MRVISTVQPSGPPPDKPQILNPVLVTLDVPLFYQTERGPTLWAHPVFCAAKFADSVLLQLNRFALEHSYALVHLGFYNPRKARRRDGTFITPIRWSNHAFGGAVDFKGVISQSGEGDFLQVARMPADQVADIREECARAILGVGERPEIVDEGAWLHIGIWHSVTL